MITVRALRTGFYGGSRYREGQQFEVKDEKELSKTWMERVESDDILTPTEGEPGKKEGGKKDGEKKEGEKKDGEKKDGEKKEGEKKEEGEGSHYTYGRRNK